MSNILDLYYTEQKHLKFGYNYRRIVSRIFTEAYCEHTINSQNAIKHMIPFSNKLN